MVSAAERAAYETWDAIWNKLAVLKKRYQPDAVPLELWAPLAQQCGEAFIEMQRIRSTRGLDV